MRAHKILFSNLGYARGIGGHLKHHILGVHRHIYCPLGVQKKSLQLLRAIILKETPDICCLVEIDKGSFTSAGFDQLAALLDENYMFFDIENKYAPGSRLRSFFLTRGKSNAFISKRHIPHEKVHFSHGIKRLVYKVHLDEETTLFFAHFSLNREQRAKQLLEAKELMLQTPGETIFLGDFNILNGMAELGPLLDQSNLILLNRQSDTTFTFHTRKLLLDLCICTSGIAKRAHLEVIPQPFSDHAALLLHVERD